MPDSARYVLIVALGGAFGAVTRYGVSLWIGRRFGTDFPWGTMVVNIAGCFLIGLMMQLLISRAWFDDQMRLLIITGFLGSLTTFSTFGYDTVVLLDQQRWPAALASVLTNLFIGLAAVYLGQFVGRALD